MIDREVEGIDITRNVWFSWSEKLQLAWVRWLGRRRIFVDDVFMLNVDRNNVKVFVYCRHQTSRHLAQHCPVDPKEPGTIVCHQVLEYRSSHPPIDSPGAETSISH